MGMSKEPENDGPAEIGDQAAGRPQEGQRADSLRKRLRKRIGAGPSVGEDPADAAPRRRPATIIYHRDLPRPAGPPARQPLVAGPFVALADAVQGTEAQAPDGGQALLLEIPADGLDPQWRGLSESFRRCLAAADSPLRQHLAGLCQDRPPSPEQVLFFDLETTGLTGSPLFLIGTLVWEAGGLVVRQYFARDYSQERAAISLLARQLACKTLLVSFNGKSFDLPYLRVRAAATGLALRAEQAHLDLLHVARRAWGHSLPDCRLQTLERVICGRPRSDDIPSHLIPQAYHDFVRTGNARQMAECLKHNQLDLLTLADLATKLPPPA